MVIASVMMGAYCVLILAYRIGWARARVFKGSMDFNPSVKVSVIIPARNEATCIGHCLKATLAQHYPPELLEVIVVDDHSEDGTWGVIEGFGAHKVRCLRLSDVLVPGQEIKSYKKAALAYGIAQSSGELIVTTDADCVAPKDWLRTIAARYEEGRPDMIVAPVAYKWEGRLSAIFQLLDFMGMQGITFAALALKLGNMANGANLAFSRAAYEKVGGYAGVDHLASGDDYLLMTKIAMMPGAVIAGLKSQDAIVSTSPQPGWGAFFSQRVRWASKSGKYEDKRLTGILVLVYLFNCALLAFLVAGFFQSVAWNIGAIMLGIKIVVELFFLWPVAGFYGQRRALWLFPILQPLHVLYIVSAGFLGFFGGFEWKGRKVVRSG